LLLNIVNIPSKPGLPTSTYFSNSILEIVVDFLNVQVRKTHFSKLLSPKTKKTQKNYHLKKSVFKFQMEHFPG
jgi:hypothetical protein